MDQDLKKSQQYLESNELDKAENIYHKILQIKPDNIDVLMKMGILKIKKQNFRESIVFFQKIINLSQDSIDAYINLSNVYIILNQYSDAIKILEKSIKFEPKNFTLIKNLSFVYLNTNQLELALDTVNFGLQFDNKNFYLLNIQGGIFIKKKEINLGIQVFKKIIKIEINFWPAYDNLFNIFEKTNQLKDYKNYLSKAKKIFNKNFNFQFYEAMYFFRKNEFTVSKKILLKIDLDEISNNILFLVKYHDLLAKNHDKLNENENSFKQFNKRNNFKSKLNENIKYDKNIILNTINSYSNFYKEKKYKFIKKEKKLNFKNAPVFLIGFPRSGTTLLDSILRSHSNTIVLEEQPIISQIRDSFFLSNNSLLSSLNKIDSKDISLLQKKYFKLALKLSIIDNFNDKLIIDKFPLNIMEVGFINKIFPNSKFILALRHPCDVIISCFTADFKINEAMVNFLKLDDAIILYDRIFTLWDQYTKELEIEYHTIKYEDIIFDFDKNIKNLINFLELDWQNDLKNFQKTAKSRVKINTPSYNQVIQPLYSASIGRWKKYEKIINLYPKLEKWINKFNY